MLISACSMRSLLLTLLLLSSVAFAAEEAMPEATIMSMPEAVVADATTQAQAAPLDNKVNRPDEGPAARSPAPARVSGDRPIQPEHTASLPVSNRDVNRIHCPQPVQDVFWSKEKPAEVTADGNNVFVKFMVRREGEKETAAKKPVDVHVVCMDQVYTLILYPSDIDSVTLQLGTGPQLQAAAVLKEWGGLPLEDRVKKLTLAVFRDELPTSFQKARLQDDRQHARRWHNIAVRAIQRVTAPGLGLAAVEFEVVALAPVTLNERDFLTTDYSRDIVAITIEPLVLERAHQRARVILIERSVGHDR